MIVLNTIGRRLFCAEARWRQLRQQVLTIQTVQTPNSLTLTAALPA